MAIAKIAEGNLHGGALSVFTVDVDFGSIATVTQTMVEIDISAHCGVGDKVVAVTFEAEMNDDVFFSSVAKIADSTGTKLQLSAYNPTGGSLDPGAVVAIVTVLRKVVAA